ncbi:MAG TPA: beta-ketoacyl-[acyl-carrier-protein] synthase family protein [Blastocatellia bacterium]
MRENGLGLDERIVVTGIGLVTSIGLGRECFWDSLMQGRSGVSVVESQVTAAFSVHRGAEVKGFGHQKYFLRTDPATMGRASHLAIAAARMALEDAGLDSADVDQERAGIAIGTTMGEQQEIEEFDEWQLRGKACLSSRALTKRYPCHLIAGHLASEFQFSGSSISIPGACAAGNHAIAYAYDAIRFGRADVMLAGGTEPFSRMIFTGFARLGAIAPELCQPFDRGRKGMIPGEGAGMLVLEPLAGALKRGARIFAEVAGYGLSCDAHHITGSHPEGKGAARAMEKALVNSGLRPADVSYISAHGTGTKTNDRLETVAIKRAFKDDAYQIPVSSIKSMLGHTMGAASAIEAAACALSVFYDRIPPTINLQEADPECDLDYVPNLAREHTVNVAVNNAYGFGGNNASLVLTKCEGIP